MFSYFYKVELIFKWDTFIKKEKPIVHRAPNQKVTTSKLKLRQCFRCDANRWWCRDYAKG